MKMKDLHKKYQNQKNDTVFLDVRSKDEYAQAHVPGAINIPHDTICGEIASVPKTASVAIYCRSGRRAQIARDALLGCGYTNLFCVDDSGMDDWMKLGYEYHSKY